MVIGRWSQPGFLLFLSLSCWLLLASLYEATRPALLRQTMGGVKRWTDTGPDSALAVRWKGFFDMPNQPASKIVFIKLQKVCSEHVFQLWTECAFSRSEPPQVGSTTFANLLFRHASTWGLKLTNKEARVQTADIHWHHIKYPQWVANPTVPGTPLFIAAFRDPLSHASSLFYYRLGQTRLHEYLTKIYPRAMTYREERPGNFSREHLDLIREFTERKKPAKDEPGLRMSSTPLIFEWFADTVEGAADVLERENFTVLLSHERDRSLAMVRRRIGWGLREIIYLSLNKYKHPKVTDWPLSAQRALNVTLERDFTFWERVQERWHEQVRVIGKDVVDREAAALKDVRKALAEECGMESEVTGERDEESGEEEGFPPMCMFCGVDVLNTCFLSRFDGCTNGTAPVSQNRLCGVINRAVALFGEASRQGGTHE